MIDIFLIFHSLFFLSAAHPPWEKWSRAYCDIYQAFCWVDWLIQRQQKVWDRLGCYLHYFLQTKTDCERGVCFPFSRGRLFFKCVSFFCNSNPGYSSLVLEVVSDFRCKVYIQSRQLVKTFCFHRVVSTYFLYTS